MTKLSIMPVKHFLLSFIIPIILSVDIYTINDYGETTVVKGQTSDTPASRF